MAESQPRLHSEHNSRGLARFLSVPSIRFIDL